jgi:hypothetical protein
MDTRRLNTERNWAAALARAAAAKRPRAPSWWGRHASAVGLVNALIATAALFYTLSEVSFFWAMFSWFAVSTETGSRS